MLAYFINWGISFRFNMFLNIIFNKGVRIYVDAVINHMAANGGNGRGSGGSGYNPGSLSYRYIWIAMDRSKR